MEPENNLVLVENGWLQVVSVMSWVLSGSFNWFLGGFTWLQMVSTEFRLFIVLVSTTFINQFFIVVLEYVFFQVSSIEWYHSVHWGIDPPPNQKHPPPFFLAKPPLFRGFNHPQQKKKGGGAHYGYSNIIFFACKNLVFMLI